MVSVLLENTIEYYGEKFDEFSGYNVPESVSLKWTGFTASNVPHEATNVEITIGNL